jgi:signal peptidase I
MEANLTKKTDTLQELKSLLYVVLVALAIRVFIIELFFVPTGSMKITILENDYVFSTKYSYGYSKHSFPFSPNILSGRIFAKAPERGDIVIFRPPHDMEIRYIKRLIGLPGDKLQLINDVIYINDQPIQRKEIGKCVGEDGQKYKKYREILPNGVSYISYKHDQDQANKIIFSNKSNTEVFYIPNGKYFFLGDNRDDSRDSRFELGFVPFENFIAKAQFILFSTKELLWLEHATIIERFTRIWPWLESIRFDRIVKNLYTE